MYDLDMVYVFRFMNPLMELVIYLYAFRIEHNTGNYFGTLVSEFQKLINALCAE